MASFEQPPQSSALAITSYDTALCIIPPAHLQSQIDSLRELYDKAHGKWPPHINLIYPFVSVNNLPRAIDLISSKLSGLGPHAGRKGFNLRVDEADHFSHRHSSTIFIAPSNKDNGENLKGLRSTILERFKNSNDGREYHPHLTIGQTPVNAPPLREYLLGKAGMLLPIEWQVEELVVLVRERMPENSRTESRMRVWGAINLLQGTGLDVGSLNIRSSLRFNDADSERDSISDAWGNSGERTAVTRSPLLDQRGARKTSTGRPGISYCFSPRYSVWKPVDYSTPQPCFGPTPSSLRISTYNVLHDTSLALPTEERFPLVLRSILSEYASSDILILQEVSDDFLTCLLSDSTICSQYAFATHAPINPLPSLRNIVVLSQWVFTWEYFPFEQRHKGAALLQFSSIGTLNGERPLIVAGVHLSSGLSDNMVAARKSQLQALMSHLSNTYAANPWIVAGDFNIATCRAIIDEAIQTKSISAETARVAGDLIVLLEAKGLVDAWVTAGSKGEGDVYDGDQGATFDPVNNPLAAETVRNAGSKNMRPRRYDRIFVKGEDLVEAVDFNMFGLYDTSNDDRIGLKGRNGEVPLCCGSDHYGIRATLSIDSFSFTSTEQHPQGAQHRTIQLRQAPSRLMDPSTLGKCLTSNSAFPSQAETQQRMDALALLNTILQSSTSQSRYLPHTSSSPPNSTDQPPIIILPVGSYALGTYLPTSDLDVLAIGSFRAPAFFTSTVRRIQKYDDSGVKILRKVDAATGTMLELEILGVRCDLQYCCAPSVVSRWKEIEGSDALDPTIFQLPIQALQKLNSHRDMEYLKSTITPPHMREFKLAHRFLHVWARARGVYAGKFGFLNGFTITLMLFRIVKGLSNPQDATATHLICTFFAHYASLNWGEEVVLDADFEVDKKRYRRSAREVMVVLSLHAPRVNVMRSASLPALKSIIEELQRADRLLNQDGATWESLVGDDSSVGKEGGGVKEFLEAHKSYVKIDVSYWGSSLAKGSSLVGWLESKCIVLLVGKSSYSGQNRALLIKEADLSRKLPGIHARIWPARFAQQDREFVGEMDDEYQGCYLISLRKVTNIEDRPMTDSDRKMARNALRTSLESFADQIRGDEKYFDPNTSWVDVKHVKQSDLGGLELDKRDWGSYMGGVHARDIGEDDMAEETGDQIVFSNEDEDNNDETEPYVAKAKLNSTPASKANRSATATSSRAISSNKLRPASDILSRLRWDPDLDPNDYMVGYIDRFIGAKEQGLDQWKSEQTDEEFIPQHRIIYFKRKSDGIRVWDREARLDLVFGSGNGPGTG